MAVTRRFGALSAFAALLAAAALLLAAAPADADKAATTAADAAAAAAPLTGGAKAVAAALAALQAAEGDLEPQLAALEKLRKLVAKRENAQHILEQGGLPAVVALLDPPHAMPLRAAAAAAIGAAANGNPPFIAGALRAHPGAPASLLAVTQLPDEAAAGRGLFALGAVVRNSRDARAAFFAVSGLSHLEAAAAQGAASQKMRGRALRLLTDLLELSFEASNLEEEEEEAGEEGREGGAPADGGGDAVQRLAGSVLPQFASASLHLLDDPEAGMRGTETALLALRTILARRPDGVVALRELGAEASLTRALLRLGGSVEEALGGADAAVPPPGACAAGDGGDGGQACGGGGATIEEVEEEQRRYLATLCGDILAEVVEEDGGGDGGDGADSAGAHDEL